MLAYLVAGHPVALVMFMVFQSPLDYFCNSLDYYFCCCPGTCPLLSLLCRDLCDGWNSPKPPPPLPVLCLRNQSSLRWEGAVAAQTRLGG